ncbi:TIGR03885 family FMN-dependent LLM class oxidoreductase [Arthrobacter burdickii]|uniref:TIGR03885 family FMN-dependent LLM class oxidoreductase n=1 Tax=Arthrobacter burdickii TaxID=3035920 RepID=A0ABT8K034_9MICC|nr:TIGR03885 family FMN-dependent LLM class oxidoreductase [Arthrobacter burdickii]MDN4610788.1 TIGR03885 family FMN-dependent LLM class oxidoreductase [Arthrobacter burdickii]
MTELGFHCSHEQLGPRQLLDNVKKAEDAGFTAAMCSDHLSPWSERQGESGFAWTWLGSALEATSLSLGVVTAPGQRYHPVITAQAIATVESMYPGRFWAALGSGEAMNEHVTGQRWPSKPERKARLAECIDIIRALLAGEEVSHQGLVTVDRARVWSLPDTPPPLIGAAVTRETAAWVASWADGLATILQPMDELRKVIDAYRDAGGRGDVVIQTQVSVAPSREEALSIAHDQWRTNVFPPPLCWDLETAEHYDQAAEHVTPAAVAESVFVTDDPGQLADLLAAISEQGADRIYLHNVGKEQDFFLTAMAEQVMPQLGLPRRHAPHDVVAGS